MKRNVGLDLLKILACFAVVAAHVTIDSSDLLNVVLYYMSGCAVQIFFMVNGNLLLNKRSIDYNYVIKKILNILFVVFSWNVLLGGSKLITKHEFANPIVTSMQNLIQDDYFWQFWFLGSLILIYLILPIIHKHFKSTKVALFMTGFCILISVLIDLTSVFRATLGYSIIQIHVIQTFRIWTWMAYFLLGGLLGKTNIKDLLKRKITLSRNVIMVVCMVISVVLYQYNIGRYIYKIRSLEYFYDNIIIFVWVFSLFILLYRLDYSKVKYNIISIVSNNIMGVYIIHVTIINKLVYHYGFESSLGNILLILIVFISSLTLSIIISKIPIINRLVKL